MRGHESSCWRSGRQAVAMRPVVLLGALSANPRDTDLAMICALKEQTSHTVRTLEWGTDEADSTLDLSNERNRERRRKRAMRLWFVEKFVERNVAFSQPLKNMEALGGVEPPTNGLGTPQRLMIPR